MRYSLKFISTLILGFVLGLLVPRKSEVVLEPATEVYKEVAHISPLSYANCKLIYTDEINDISYYVANDRISELTVNSTVTDSDGHSYNVIDIDVRGFYVEIGTNTVRAGCSGEPLWYNNHIIGYISQMHDSGILYCIWSS